MHACPSRRRARSNAYSVRGDVSEDRREDTKAFRTTLISAKLLCLCSQHPRTREKMVQYGRHWTETIDRRSDPSPSPRPMFRTR